MANTTPTSTMDKESVLAALRATGWVVQGPAGAATVLGMNPGTLIYRLNKMGIKRPRRPARVERHTPVVQLLLELEQLRARARAVVRVYLPGPRRADYLRELEIEQRAVTQRLRALLNTPP